MPVIGVASASMTEDYAPRPGPLWRCSRLTKGAVYCVRSEVRLDAIQQRTNGSSDKHWSVAVADRGRSWSRHASAANDHRSTNMFGALLNRRDAGSGRRGDKLESDERIDSRFGDDKIRRDQKSVFVASMGVPLKNPKPMKGLPGQNRKHSGVTCGWRQRHGGSGLGNRNECRDRRRRLSVLPAAKGEVGHPAGTGGLAGSGQLPECPVRTQRRAVQPTRRDGDRHCW